MGSHYHCVQPQNAFEATKSHFGERYLRRCERMSRNAAPGVPYLTMRGAYSKRVGCLGICGHMLLELRPISKIDVLIID